jgi:hypothetical protein
MRIYCFCFSFFLEKNKFQKCLTPFETTKKNTPSFLSPASGSKNVYPKLLDNCPPTKATIGQKIPCFHEGAGGGSIIRHTKNTFFWQKFQNMLFFNFFLKYLFLFFFLQKLVSFWTKNSKTFFFSKKIFSKIVFAQKYFFSFFVLQKWLNSSAKNNLAKNIFFDKKGIWQKYFFEFVSPKSD